MPVSVPTGEGSRFIAVIECSICNVIIVVGVLPSKVIAVKKFLFFLKESFVGFFTKFSHPVFVIGMIGHPFSVESGVVTGVHAMISLVMESRHDVIERIPDQMNDSRQTAERVIRIAIMR